MEQIVIRVKTKEKAQLLLDLLASLDFVEMATMQSDQPEKTASREDDFFALAGLWAERDIDLTTIREKAWPRQQS